MVKPLQSPKAYTPIDVTLLGIVTEVKDTKPYAKKFGIRCTLSPISMVVIGQLVNGV